MTSQKVIAVLPIIPRTEVLMASVQQKTEFLLSDQTDCSLNTSDHVSSFDGAVEECCSTEDARVIFGRPGQESHECHPFTGSPSALAAVTLQNKHVTGSSFTKCEKGVF